MNSPGRGRPGHVAALAAALAACGTEPAQPDAAECAQAIVAGHGEPTLIALSDAERRSIVALELPATSTRPAGLCSGIAVAPSTILTAAHCFDPDRDGTTDGNVTRASVLIEAAPAAHGSRAAVADVTLHDELDVALVTLSFAEPLEPPLLPLPLSELAPDATWVGGLVELAGYGASLEAGPGALAFVVETIASLEPDHILVDGRGRTGACAGDSGGPLFGRADDGRMRVLGVLDAGDPSCTGRDAYTRLDRLADWAPLSNLRAPEEEPSGCAGLGPAGSCERGRAMWCQDGVPQVETCAGRDQGCGWDTVENGFRCVAAADDPCRGLGSYAACEETQRVRCVGGTIVARDCGRCGSACEAGVDAEGAGCVP